MSFQPLPNRRWLVEDDHFAPVTFAAGHNVYLSQSSPDSRRTVTIVLSAEGARSLADALLEALS